MQPVQVKMARAALGLSASDLAKQAGISADAVERLEGGGAAEPEAAQGLSLFFASKGVELIDNDGVRAKAPETRAAVTVEDLTTGNDGGQG